MDLSVELADGTLKNVQVPRNCTVEGAVKLLIQRTGLESVSDKFAEFSLARQDENSDAWINVSWLDPTTLLGDQGITRSTTLLFRKKYFGPNSDLHSLDSCQPLLQNVYAQLHHTFAAGLYQCSTFQAAQIAALAVRVEMSGTDLTFGSLQKSRCLEWILPAKFSSTPGIDQIVLKAAKNAEHFSVEEAQRAFVQRLQKLETFGLVFYTATYKEHGRKFDGLLGIGVENLFKIDREEMEIISQWEIADLGDYHYDGNNFTLVFSNQEVTMATKYGHVIHSYLSGIVPAKSEPAVSSGEDSGTSGNESKSPVEVSDVRKRFEPPLRSPPPKVLPKPPSKAPKPKVLPKPDTSKPPSVEKGIKSPSKPQSPKHPQQPSPVRKHPPPVITKPKPTRPRASTSPASSLKDKAPGRHHVPASPNRLQQLGSLFEEQSSGGRVVSPPPREQPLSPQRFQSPISPIRYQKPKTSWQEPPMSPTRLQKVPASPTAATTTTETSGVLKTQLTKQLKAAQKAKKPLELPSRLRKEQERADQLQNGVSSPSSTSPEPEDYLTPVSSPENRIAEAVYSDIEFQEDEKGSTPQPAYQGARRQSAPAELQSPQHQTQSPTPAGLTNFDEEEEQIYDIVCDDIEEVSKILGNSHDLSREVEFSREKNPLYNTAAASEAQTLLRNSNVTFTALNRSFKKNQSPDRSPLSSVSSSADVRADPLVSGIERQQQLVQTKPPGKRAPLLPPKPGRLSSMSSEPSSPRSPKLGTTAERKYEDAVELTRHPFPPSIPKKPAANQSQNHSASPIIARLRDTSTEVECAEYSDPVELRRVLGKTHAPVAQPSRSSGITKLGATSMSEYTYVGVYGGAGESRKHRPSKQPQPIKSPGIRKLSASADIAYHEYEDIDEDDESIQTELSPRIPPKQPTVPRKEKRNSANMSSPGMTRISMATEMRYHEYEDIDEDDDTSQAPTLPPPPVPKQHVAPSKRHPAAVLTPTGRGMARFGAPVKETPPPIPPKDRRFSVPILLAGMTKFGVTADTGEDYEDIDEEETYPPPPIAKQPKIPPKTHAPTSGITKLGVATDTGDDDYEDIDYEDIDEEETYPPPPIAKQPKIPPKTSTAAASTSGITRLGVVDMDEEHDAIYDSSSHLRDTQPLLPRPNVKRQPKPSPSPVTKRYSAAAGLAAGSRSPITRISVVSEPMAPEEVYTNPEEMYSPNTKKKQLPSAAKSRSPISRISVVNDPMDSKELYTNPEEMYSPNTRKRLQSNGGISTQSADELHQPHQGETAAYAGGRGINGEFQKVNGRPPKPPRGWKMKQPEEVPCTKSKHPPKPVRAGETLKDYATLMREFRVFFVKLPTGIVHPALANLNAAVHKLISQLCALLGAKDPNEYSLFVEGAALTSLKEKGQLEVSTDENAPEERQPLLINNGKKPQYKSATTALEHFTFLRSFTVLPDQGLEPIQLNPGISFREHGVTTARILALRPKPTCTETLPRGPLRVPDWVKFHQCWLSIVQGVQPCSLQDAVQLAALQYQAYFLDRIEPKSVIAFCKSSDFLPLEYASVKGMEDKVFREQQSLKGYTQKKAQDSYIHTCGTLPTFGTVFFPCKELKKRVFQNSKLTPILIGISQEGVLRVDTKTKEVLDMWPYQVLRNWGHSMGTFVLDFVDSSYPVKTNQGKWMNSLIDFHLETLLRTNLPVPPSHTVVHDSPPQHRPRKEDSAIALHPDRSNEADVEQIYEELLSLRRSPRTEARQLSNSYSPSPGSHSPSPAPIHTPTPPHSASRPLYNLPGATEEAIYEVPADDIVPLVPASGSTHYQDDDIYDTPEAVLQN